ncbi:OLC1v1009039C1 [Oldenlandia corymbosa var. corymbosa]|uniref:OLC1v1009039C1 n=1 Tax=Oldenlandia corymbosa var. corymbosa TaxID=529605 RepID=A0AAV1DQH2_OLDCO|nr:OLC1v1009039C1 [Oldenlandia corymbosa var. corymbosa]
MNRALSCDQKQHKYLEWLDQQPSKSVLFVSFGSNTSLSDEQIEEIDVGVRNNNQRFIWVLRCADREMFSPPRR